MSDPLWGHDLWVVCGRPSNETQIKWIAISALLLVAFILGVSWWSYC